VVAYSFKRHFAEPILAGTKGGTIRADRRRHARPGEEMQLYVGMRTKKCRLITRRTCIAIEAIELDFFLRFVAWPDQSRVIVSTTDLDALAVFDGFESFEAMQHFWLRQHASKFEGWHIRWLPFHAAASRAAD
jgi:uncharacterized protein YqfB (UPF0267 family)